MRRGRSRQTAIALALLLGACALAITWSEGPWRRIAPVASAGARRERAPETLAAATRGESAELPAERAPASAAPGSAASAGTEARAAEPRAEIQVSVADQLGRAVLPCQVELRSGARETRGLALDARGRAAFDVLPGEYELRVRAEGLAPGWLVPWGQDWESVPAGDPFARPGFLARAVSIQSAGERATVELRVFRAARSSGLVLGLAGEPVEGIGVRLRSSEHEGLIVDARTDAEGRYAFAGLYPGAYELLARPAQARRPELRGLPETPPLAVAIAEGEDALLSDLHLCAGLRELAGSVLDQDDRPLEGIEVCAQAIAPSDPIAKSMHQASWPAVRARTDAQGRFRLGDLPAERVLVRIEPGFDPTAPLFERRLAAAVEPVEVDLGGEEESHELAPVRVRASRPFVARVTVTLDPRWAGEHGLTLDDLRARVEGGDERGPGSELRLDPSRAEVRWCAETPHESVVLFVGCGEAERSLRLDPLPDRETTLALELP